MLLAKSFMYPIEIKRNAHRTFVSRVSFSYQSIESNFKFRICLHMLDTQELAASFDVDSSVLIVKSPVKFIIHTSVATTDIECNVYQSRFTFIFSRIKNRKIVHAICNANRNKAPIKAIYEPFN